MASSQEQIVSRYHELMQVNAVSHLLRTARQIGALDRLRQGQHTVEQLSEHLSLQIQPTRLLMDALVAVGIVEQYGDDYALSQAAQLLCQYDQDFGDAVWSELAGSLSSTASSGRESSERFFDQQSATQWVHTPAAIQAAEILDLGSDELQGCHILDLGCGSAVWSCAMGHRDPSAKVTMVDHAGAIEAAKSTAASIDMLDRVETIAGDFLTTEIPANAFDLVLVAQRVGGLSDDEAVSLVRRAAEAATPGGRVVLIDLFRAPASKAKDSETASQSSDSVDQDPVDQDPGAYAKPTLAESIEALKIHLGTDGGRLRTLGQAQQLLIDAGLAQVQFAYLSASRLNLGIAVGVKA
mgnify:CR=1 FL=1|tara:strand:- start:41996 stop:43054 length:1059 start_codon:yes stop_codon:yes gene_type:complete